MVIVRLAANLPPTPAGASKRFGANFDLDDRKIFLVLASRDGTNSASLMRAHPIRAVPAFDGINGIKTESIRLRSSTLMLSMRVQVSMSLQQGHAMKPRSGLVPVSATKASVRKEASAQTIRRKRRPKGAPKRREQQRAIETRQMILEAALSEFAERGFDAASIRNIAMRIGLQHPLITYHYRTKEILWRAVAEYAFAEIRKMWDEGPDDKNLSPMESLRAKYSALLRFTVAHPDFHHFMLRESRPGNPRLPWLVNTILLPAMKRLLPQIQLAQQRNELPKGNPVLIHYLLVGMCSVLSSLKDEIRQASGIATEDPRVVESYLSLIDTFVFYSRRDLHPKLRKKRRDSTS
jgi:AcrR family transcriptional regulator